MKTTYNNEYCYAELSHVGDAYELNRIITRKNRGQGYGSKLLKAICQDADKEGCVLRLGINSYGAMSEDHLRLWYGRNGFFHSKNGVYVRMPK